MRVQVLLVQAIWIFLPALRHPPCFDFLVLLAPVSLLRNWHKSRIDDLATTGLQTLGSEVLLKQLKNRFDKTRFSQFEGLLRNVAFPKEISQTSAAQATLMQPQPHLQHLHPPSQMRSI
jgi:hypothetical protein